jgi:hypothetical protein
LKKNESILKSQAKQMKAHCTIFFILIILLSCSDSDPVKKPENNMVPTNETSLKKPGATFQDTVFVSEAAAVFFSPDSAQLSKLKAVTDTMIFESMEHDCFYQMRNARRVLSSNYKSLPIFEILKGRYIKFQLADGSFQIIDLDLNNEPCGLYLFRKDKEPRFADMMNIDTELGFYFNK